jgi:hypothetical protein
LYRTATAEAHTLLIGEAHSLILGNPQLQRILNAGHCRDAAAVARADGTFDLWCAKIIALIGELPASLADRALRIHLKRKRAGEAVTPLHAIVPMLQGLAGHAARWSAQHLDRITAADPVMPESVINRAADNWRPLLAIADMAGGRWPDLARALAIKAAAETAIEDISAVALLSEHLGGTAVAAVPPRWPHYALPTGPTVASVRHSLHHNSVRGGSGEGLLSSRFPRSLRTVREIIAEGVVGDSGRRRFDCRISTVPQTRRLRETLPRACS